MNQIPTLKQIAENFRQDVQVPGWRGVGLPPEQKLVYHGRQKELLDYLIGLSLHDQAGRKRIIAQIRSEKDILQRGRIVRKILRRVQGLAQLPERTPLNPRLAPAFEREGYRVEHLVLESRPDFYVTGAFYIPTNYPPPYPAVLYVLGHSLNGKARYQRVPANLAIKGIAVLVIDPPGQGERDEYVDIPTGKRTVDRACRQHGCAGNPAYLVGSNFGAYRLWDAMRCIDYLQDCPDIQPKRIGVSGTSGGGWEALWLAAIDPRIAAINTNCYTTTFHRRIENRIADAEPDPEQDPFGLLAAGLDAADLLLACYPRPISLGVTLHDIFPYDGAMDCYNEARLLYGLEKKEDRIKLTVSDAAHENTLAMRKQTYRWMLQWLSRDPKPDDSETPDWKDEPDENLYATRTGIVLTSLGGKTSAQLTAETSRELARDRKRLARHPAWFPSIPRRLRQLLGIPKRSQSAEVRCVAEHSAGSSTVIEMLISNSHGLTLAGHLWKSPGPAAKSAVIYISPKPKNYDPLANELCKRLAGDGQMVLDFDPRGMGPMDEAYLQFVPLIESTMTYDGFLLGRQILAMRVSDVLLAVDFLTGSKKIDPAHITLHGRDYGALLALFAGCIDTRIGSVVEEKSLGSYSSLCYNRSYAWPASFILPNVLTQMDINDIRASIAPRKLMILHPLDHLNAPLPAEHFQSVQRQYRRAKAPRNLMIVPSPGAPGEG